MKLISSLELEKLTLAAVLRNPECFAEIDGSISETDFSNKMHQTIWGVMRQIMRNGDHLDKFIVSQRINALSLSFEDKVSDILSYLTDLSLIQINHNSVKGIAEELKLVTIRREMAETGKLIIDEMVKANKVTDYKEVVSLADKIYNNKISLWSWGGSDVEDLCLNLPDLIHQRGLTPGVEIGLKGPHPLLHQMYGSILRPSNISVVCARAKAGKSSWLCDYSYKASKMNGDVPILHIDMGEMSKEELQLRLAANLSGVPLGYIEDGTYIYNKEMTTALKGVSAEIKGRKFFYLNAAGRSVEDIISSIKRWYLSKVGRGNQAIICLDYLKAQSDMSSSNKAEWERMGLLLTKLKDFVSSEAKLPILTAVQGNRTAIVGSKSSAELVEDESIISGGDRVAMYASHVFLLRRKTHNELDAEHQKYGTHVLKPIVNRFLGKDVSRALKKVQVENSYRDNYLNFTIDNFRVIENGDYRSQIEGFTKLKITKKVADVDI